MSSPEHSAQQRRAVRGEEANLERMSLTSGDGQSCPPTADTHKCANRRAKFYPSISSDYDHKSWDLITSLRKVVVSRIWSAGASKCQFAMKLPSCCENQVKKPIRCSSSLRFKISASLHSGIAGISSFKSKKLVSWWPPQMRCFPGKNYKGARG